MSTCYYLACETCKECYWIGQDGLSGFTFYSGEPLCLEGLTPFMEKHVLCEPMSLKVLSEHRVEDFKEVEWPREQQLPQPDGGK